MITIAVPPWHPITVITEKEPNYHFGRLISANDALLVVELRNPFTGLADLSVTGLILDSFSRLEEETMAMITIRLAVRFVASDRDRVFRFQALELQRLRFKVRPRR